MASFVEFVLYKNEGLGVTCEPSSFCLVWRQRVMEKVVKVECSLVDQRIGLYCWILFKLHDLGLNGAIGWLAPGAGSDGPSSAHSDPS